MLLESHWVPVFLGTYWLLQFGGETPKPIHVWSNSKAVLENITPGLQLQLVSM